MGSDKANEKYAQSEKGREARARAQAKRQEKRKELAKVRLAHEMLRRDVTPAKFSKQYTLYSAFIGRTVGNVLFRPARRYNDSESETPQCVQGGIPRWSESISNPAYVKKLNEEETLVLKARKLMARLHKLLTRLR